MTNLNASTVGHQDPRPEVDENVSFEDDGDEIDTRDLLFGRVSSRYVQDGRKEESGMVLKVAQSMKLPVKEAGVVGQVVPEAENIVVCQHSAPKRNEGVRIQFATYNSSNKPATSSEHIPRTIGSLDRSTSNLGANRGLSSHPDLTPSRGGRLTGRPPFRGDSIDSTAVRVPQQF